MYMYILNEIRGVKMQVLVGQQVRQKHVVPFGILLVPRWLLLVSRWYPHGIPLVPFGTPLVPFCKGAACKRTGRYAACAFASNLFNCYGIYGTAHFAFGGNTLYNNGIGAR